jgi:hypothetical protein
MARVPASFSRVTPAAVGGEPQEVGQDAAGVHQGTFVGPNSGTAKDARTAMNPNDLKEILNNPAVSAEQKQQAIERIGDHGDPLIHLEAELLQALGKPDLAAVSFFDVQQFCKDRRFGASPLIAAATRQLYDKWLEAFFTSENGRPYLQEIASRLRDHDFGEWGHAADEWKASGWKSTASLISVLERIVDGPNRGHYHSQETVDGAAAFLVEIKRRAGEAQ